MQLGRGASAERKEEFIDSVATTLYERPAHAGVDSLRCERLKESAKEPRVVRCSFKMSRLSCVNFIDPSSLVRRDVPPDETRDPHPRDPTYLRIPDSCTLTETDHAREESPKGASPWYRRFSGTPFVGIIHVFRYSALAVTPTLGVGGTLHAAIRGGAVSVHTAEPVPPPVIPLTHAFSALLCLFLCSGEWGGGGLMILPWAARRELERGFFPRRDEA